MEQLGEVVKKTKKVLEEKYKGINIVGYENGYEQNYKKIIKKINDSKANIIFVAKGSPKQEIWIYENYKKINSNIYMGVGGSFDVISGNIKRAPKIFLKLGLEWLYRMIKEPKRFIEFPNYLRILYLGRKGE